MERQCASSDHAGAKSPGSSEKHRDTCPTHDLPTPTMCKVLHMPVKLLPQETYILVADKCPCNHNSKKSKNNSLRCTNCYEKLKEGENTTGMVKSL